MSKEKTRLPGFVHILCTYRGAGKSLARPTSRCILFDSKNISFDASLVIFINSTIIPPGAWGSVVVKALRYESDGLGIDSRWCHWGFFP